MKSSEIKIKTNELYDSLPQEKEKRIARTDVRNKVIELNYSFFGYVANHVFASGASYEDKFQSAVSHFCDDWYKYRWEGHYRCDLSFTTFFKPRISERINREFSEVGYTLRRNLCMKVGEQLGKHWAKVTYEDLSNPKLDISAEDMESLKSIFGVAYIADLDEHIKYIPDIPHFESEFEHLSDNYNTIEELLMREMIENESKLSEKDIMKISAVYSIPIDVIKEKLPKAEELLYKKLKNSVNLSDII